MADPKAGAKPSTVRTLAVPEDVRRSRRLASIRAGHGTLHLPDRAASFWHLHEFNVQLQWPGALRTPDVGGGAAAAQQLLPGWGAVYPGYHLYYANRRASPAVTLVVQALRLASGHAELEAK